MSDLKVALISHEFPPFTLGGIGIHAYDLAHSLSAKGIKTKVICGTINGSNGTTREDDYLEITRLKCPFFPPRYFWFQILNGKKINQLLEDCDVIHGVNPTASFGIALSHTFSSKALLTTSHSNSLQMLKIFSHMPLSEVSIGDISENFLSYPLDHSLEQIWFRKADRIIIPGVSAFEFMKKNNPQSITKKVVVIYNGVNFEKIAKLRNKCTGTPYEKTIICFSRLVSLKGIAQFLISSKSIFKDHPNVHLKIFGNGPLYPKLRSIVLENNLARNVALMGYVSNKEIIKELHLATIAVFPTFTEVGPFVSAIEAMACKRALVAFDFSFNREFIQDMKTGLLAKPGDMTDFVDKIKLLLCNDNLRRQLGENAFNYANRNHNWTHLADKYAKIYEETVTGKSKLNNN